MKLKIASLFIALSCYASAEAQTQLSDYRPGVTTEGAVYFLPKTAIKVKVLVERSVYKPGEFCNYAMLYLHANDVQLEANTSYRIVSVKQHPIAMVDSTKAYAVKFNAKTIAANVSLSDDGRLLAINAQPTPQPEVADFKPAAKTAEVNPRKFLNEEILAAGSTAKMAELTAQEIYDLRENRALLIKGQADFMPSDGAQMKMMLDQIELQGNALTSLFTGTVNKDTTETTLTVIPDGALKHQILFRLSQRLGIVDADDLSGEPYYITIEDLSNIPALDEAAAEKNKKKKQPESGIYVNVPGRMRSTIERNGNVLSNAEMPAPQFGRVELLSGDLFNKRYTTHLWLNTLTGSVERLEAEQPK